ncbi:hypothetical protein [Helicobacter pylori]|uniref:hypothetical protein n=1 Tax=Helicobacter pylori TaxID=210 RepID=UPI002AC56D35|nr:hypothetical protein [Helicobacter pylori]MDZ5287411.1 hypothetical protein [Helicobacter pylori]
MINYPNLPDSALEITKQPEVKEITNELLKQLQNALNSNSLFTEQVELSLKGIVRILEVLLSLDFFKNANEIDSSLRNSIEWLTNAGESLKIKMKEYESFFSEFNELLETLKPKFSGLFVGTYYIHNVIYIKGGWEQKIKDLSDYTLDKSKKYEIEVFFQFVSAQQIVERNPFFGLKVQEGFLKESIQKITHKYVSQIYYKKLLVENVSGVLGLYHGYFYGNINYFNEAIITSISAKRALKGL